MSSDQSPDSGSGQDRDPFRKEPGSTSQPGPESQGTPPGSPPPGGPGAGAGHPGGASGGESPYGTDPRGYGLGGGYPQGGYGTPGAGQPPLAGSGRRLLARIIDALIVGIPVNIVLVLAGLVNWSTDDADSMAFSANLTTSSLSALAYFLYEGYLLSTRGQTLGKMAMRIKVVMLDSGAVPSGAAGWIRAFVYSASVWICCLWPVNVLWHLFDRPYRQCLHDKVAHTVVVSTR